MARDKCAGEFTPLSHKPIVRIVCFTYVGGFLSNIVKSFPVNILWTPTVARKQVIRARYCWTIASRGNRRINSKVSLKTVKRLYRRFSEFFLIYHVDRCGSSNSFSLECTRTSSFNNSSSPSHFLSESFVNWRKIVDPWKVSGYTCPNCNKIVIRSADVGNESVAGSLSLRKCTVSCRSFPKFPLFSNDTWKWNNTT